MALSYVMVIRSALKVFQQCTDEHFKRIFRVVSDLDKKNNVEICMPRTLMEDKHIN